MQYRLEIRNSPEVKFALEVFSSLNSNNFVRFFKLVKSASYLNACILHRYFTQVRRNALRVMTKAYSPNEAYPLSVIQDLFAFEDKDEVCTRIFLLLLLHLLLLLLNIFIAGISYFRLLVSALTIILLQVTSLSSSQKCHSLIPRVRFHPRERPML